MNLTTLPGQIAQWLESLPEHARDQAAVELVQTLIESLDPLGPAYATLWNACSDVRGDMQRDAEAMAEYQERPASAFRLELYEQDKYLDGAFANGRQAA